MSTVTIQKLTAQGKPVVSYEGQIVARFPGGVRVEAWWTLPARELGYTRFEPGDRFVEWYYADRWYSIFQVHAGATPTIKGWYCNIASPAAIAGETIACRDLLLDLWVAADGTTQVLDEDEFAVASDLDTATRAAATHALAELLALVRSRQPPFDVIPARAGA